MQTIDVDCCGLDLGVVKKRNMRSNKVVLSSPATKKLKKSNLETHLLGLSGNVYFIYPKISKNVGVDKKKDGDAVPVELWLYWLNAILTSLLSLDQLYIHVVV